MLRCNGKAKEVRQDKMRPRQYKYYMIIIHCTVAVLYSVYTIVFSVPGGFKRTKLLCMQRMKLHLKVNNLKPFTP